MGQLADPDFRFLDAVGDPVTTTLGKVDGAVVVRGRPVRALPSYRGQRNYPGWLWLETTGSLVGYESLLERDRLWLADFDPDVRWVAGQPFWLSGREGDAIRRHVPDFLLQTATGFRVVDVKPADLVSSPAVAEVFAWTGRCCAAKGWAYEVWSGADPVLLRNIRFLAAGRRLRLVDEDALVKVVGAGRVGRRLTEAEAASGAGPAVARSASLALLWSGQWATDMTSPLSGSSVLQRVA